MRGVKVPVVAIHSQEREVSQADSMFSRNISTLSLAALLSAILLTLAGTAQATSACRQGTSAHIWTAPLEPRPGKPLQVMAVSTAEPIEEILVTDAMGRRSRLSTVRGGGPPWSRRGSLSHTSARGTYRIEAKREGQVVACTKRDVTGTGDRGDGEWNLAAEAFYAAWIEHLFDAPIEQSLSFPSLEPVLRNPGRNFLHDYLREGEDRRIRAVPDCADLPYFLRAYFAWKLGLPMAYRACSRGSRNSPPVCKAPRIDKQFTRARAAASRFRDLSRDIMNGVHSDCGRTALDDDRTDFYPVALERWTLWPGTLFADPYGHLMVLVKWVPQTPGRSGLLLAVDAQPDNSVTRKRFWEGNFLFAQTPSAGAGFKAYRAPVPVGAKGNVRPLPNSALNGRSALRPYSREQARLSPDDFYARMQQLINPQGLRPEAAYRAVFEALMEQIRTRVKSVENGEQYMRSHRKTVPMPRGSAIFETVGSWEDYSTPSRDMRLLIALKVVERLPERIRRYPELFVLEGEAPSKAAARVERLHERRTRESFITYTRSDASTWRLSLEDIYRRRPELEVAYNPNDCVERRWGASPGTTEHATCRRRAPAGQRARMEKYRSWFRETRRPPR